MPLKPTPDDTPQLNLTPMIDVVFLLVIFFMAATQFAEVERAVELQLPETPADGTTVAAVEDPLVITVQSDGALLLAGKPITPEAMIEELGAYAGDRPDQEVLIHGDARCPYQHVASALAACRAAGVTNVGVTVEAIASTEPPTAR